MSEALKPDRVAWCSGQKFNDFLAANPALDDADLQWYAYRAYWTHAAGGHRQAIIAVLNDLHERHPAPFSPPLRSTG